MGEDQYVYVAVKVLNRTKKTKKIKIEQNKNDIVWNKKMQFVVYEQPEMLYFDVLIKNNNKKIGEYALPINALFIGGHPGYKTEVKLQEIECGAIDLELKCKELLNEDEDEEEGEEEKQYKINKAVTLNIDVLSGHNLNTSMLPLQYNPFIVVNALNQSFKTNKIINNEHPKWNEKAIFKFMKNEQKPKQILFEVYNDRLSPQIAELIGSQTYDIDKSLYSQPKESKVTELVINTKTASTISIKVKIQ